MELSRVIFLSEGTVTARKDELIAKQAAKTTYPREGTVTHVSPERKFRTSLKQPIPARGR